VSSLIKWLEISRAKDVRGLVVSTSKELGVVGKNAVNCHYSLI